LPAPAKPPLAPRSLRHWIVNHDDSWLFVAAYIGLAVILSTFISLFWLVAVVGVHFAFEWVRQSQQRKGFGPVLAQVLWELKLDLALVLFALVMSLYLELVLALAGLGAAARMTARSGALTRVLARFPGFQRALRGIILALDDVAQAVRSFGRRKPAGSPAPIPEAARPPAAAPASGWAAPWRKSDWFTLGFGALCAALILAAPWLTDHTPETVLATFQHELRPFPTQEG
jgi:hypothetical protein